MKNKHFQHLLLLQFAILCTSTSGALGRYVELAPPLSIWWRSAFAVLFLGLFCWWRDFSFRFENRKQAGIIFVTGLLMAAHWITYFYALRLSNVAVGMLTLMTYPAITAVLEPLLLKTKRDPLLLVLAGVSLLGIFFLVPSFDLSDNITQGALMGVLSALSYSLRNIICKTQVANFNPFTLMFYQAAITIIICLPVLFIYPLEEVPQYIAPLLMLGLVTTAIGHSLFVSSFRHFSVSTASIMSSVQPVYGIIIAMLFLHEFPDARSIIGGVLILVTVIIASREA